MSEVERQNLFSRFKKHEKREIQKEQSAVKLRTSEETTAENIDHLHSLQKQFALFHDYKVILTQSPKQWSRMKVERMR
jgi:hypothetical protein